MPCSRANAEQAELMIPVPPMKRTFISYLLDEIGEHKSLAARQAPIVARQPFHRQAYCTN
jgi:hypothetical protein